MQNTFLTFRANQQLTISFKNNNVLYPNYLEIDSKIKLPLMNCNQKYLSLERAIRTSPDHPKMEILISFVAGINATLNEEKDKRKQSRKLSVAKVAVFLPSSCIQTFVL